MGAHASYPLIIENLVSLKNQFQFITEEKFQGIMKELSEYEVYFNSDNEHLPDHIQLASKLNLNQAKMNKMLRELLDKILHGLYDHPLIIKDRVHILHIWPSIEPEDENKEWAKLQWKRAITIPVDLPVTPRIGDNVEIPFIRISYSSGSDDKLYYGIVHEIRHIVRGTLQEINLYVYPHKNIYYKWQEMKEEYEKHKRWLAWLKSEFISQYYQLSLPLWNRGQNLLAIKYLYYKLQRF